MPITDSDKGQFIASESSLARQLTSETRVPGTTVCYGLPRRVGLETGEPLRPEAVVAVESRRRLDDYLMESFYPSI